MAGWIKLHRAIVDWEWYQDPNTCRLFLHLLLIANREDGTWKGIPVARGQKITSIQKLANDLDLSPMQIRTAISKLKSTGDITDEATNRFRMITICNYNKYQEKKDSDNKQDNNPHNEILTPYQQADNNKQEEKKGRRKNIPYQAVLDLYHEILPELPQVKDFTDKRRSQFRARWNGNKDRQNLDYWKRFFGYIRTCSFLMGQKTEFIADFEWLTKQGNFTKVIEQRYEDRNV